MDPKIQFATSLQVESCSSSSEGRNDSKLSESLFDTEIDAISIMADHLYAQANDNDWLVTRSQSTTTAGVIIRSRQDGFIVCRPDGYEQPSFLKLITSLNAEAILIMTNDVTRQILDRVSPMCNHLETYQAEKVDVFDSLETAFSRRRWPKNGFFVVRDVQAAIIWTDQARELIVEGVLCDKTLSNLLSYSNSTMKSQWFFEAVTEKIPEDLVTIAIRETSSDNASDLEIQLEDARTTQWTWPLIVAITFILSGLLMGKLLSAVILAIVRDKRLYQLVFIFYLPLACALSSFFLAMIVVGVFQVLGPITQMEHNSATYSGVRPKVPMYHEDLPHITIQCPVYKEGILDVLHPTFESVKEAIAAYEAQGGTASIIVNDDGMRLLDSDEQCNRKLYYAKNRIGWIARPADGVNGFLRAGAFKKASNLNFGIRTSEKVEATFLDMSAEDDCSQHHYTRALQTVIDESVGLIMAGGDIGLGQIILLIDADTRIPKDCFLDAVKEFHETPSLAILQHPSGILQVAHNFWETGLAHFTRNNYFGTRYVVSGGDTTPFFGHNAFLRFSAMKDVAETNDQNEMCWWSEYHVSEDFEIHLKLLSAGFTSRMAGYTNGEFQEGVSLTVFDEINRWEKYAFGISELIFMPIPLWYTKGPFTRLFRQFILSDMDLSAKCSNLFYMFTYFGIGLSWLMCVINYFLVGWFPLLLRAYYIDCLQILISVSVIFSLKDAFIGPFVRYRLREISLARGLLDSLKYFVIVSLFLQGISMHVSKCLIWHLCGLRMSWGATIKSVEDKATLRDELPIIWTRYKVVYLAVFVMLATVLTIAFAVPVTYRIVSMKAVFPLLWLLFWHAAMPLLFHNRSFLAELYKTQV